MAWLASIPDLIGVALLINWALNRKNRDNGGSAALSSLFVAVFAAPPPSARSHAGAGTC